MNPISTTPVRCPDPGCHWALHGIPNGQPWTETARARELATHQAAEHTAPAETPAATLHRAADKIRTLLAADDLTPGPWLSLDGGDRIIHDGPAIEFGPADYVIDEPAGNAANAEWIAAMHPGVGVALADWLETTAEYATVSVTHPTHVVRAFELARLVLGEGAQR
jgi:hypothetical protein